MIRTSEFFYECDTCEHGVIKVIRKEKDIKSEPGMVEIGMSVGKCCYCKGKEKGIKSISALNLLFSYHNFIKIDNGKKKARHSNRGKSAE